jgi:hypothetical protein
MKGRVGVLLAALVVLGGGRAVAGDVNQVETLIRQGVQLRQSGRDERALPLFQQAYELERSPRTAGQLGLCEMALGYWVDGERHLLETLASSNHPWVEKNQASLAKALETARSNIGEVTVEGAPSGAEVLVDGRLAGRLPLEKPLRLNKGPHDISLRSGDRPSATRSLNIAGADKQTVSLVLQDVEKAVEPPAVAVAPRSAAVETETATATPAPHRVLPWVTAGAATVALVFGVVETASWISKQGTFDDHIGPLRTDPSVTNKRNCGSDDPGYGGDGCQQLHDQLSTARTLAIVGYAVGGGLAVASAILFATSPAASPTTTTALSCAPDFQSKGAMCRVSF